MRQLAGIAREDAEPIAAPCQLTHQLDRARRRLRGQRQFAFVLQQPGMLGRRHLRRQRGEVAENVVLQRNLQRTLDRREVMHRQGQGAVHVEHPMADLRKAHAQSLR